MTTKRMPIPLTFFIVVAATIFLILFFGAWAVSANSADTNKTLSFGFIGGASTVNPTTPDSSQLSGLQASGLEEGNADGAGDRWWGKAFLKACPFH